MDRKNRTMLHLKQGDALASQESPLLVEAGFSLSAKVLEGPLTGVIAAQGSQDNGFWSSIQDDNLHLVMRRDGKLHRLALPDVPSPPFKVIAGIGKRGGVKLGIDDRRYQHDFRVGFAENPTEGLCLGFDAETPVGDYEAEFPFQGRLGFVKIL